MVSQSLLNFVTHLNVKGYNIILEDRYSSYSWIYDSKSIALKKHPKNFGRIFGEDFDELEEIIYTDHDILHEIGHYVAAHPDQLLFPEYGLPPGLVDNYALGPFGGEFRDINGIPKHENLEGICDGLIPDIEQNKQEFVAQLFCLHFGPKLQISADFCNEKFTWGNYHLLKNENFDQEIKQRFDEFLRKIR